MDLSCEFLSFQHCQCFKEGEGQKEEEKKSYFCLLKREDHFFPSYMCEGISRLEMLCALYLSTTSGKIGTGPRKIKVKSISTSYILKDILMALISLLSVIKLNNKIPQLHKKTVSKLPQPQIGLPEWECYYSIDKARSCSLL